MYKTTFILYFIRDKNSNRFLHKFRNYSHSINLKECRSYKSKKIALRRLKLFQSDEDYDLANGYSKIPKDLEVAEIEISMTEM